MGRNGADTGASEGSGGGSVAVFHGLTAAALGRILLDLAAGVRQSSYRKHVRGPKRPQPKRESGAKIKHVSTAKLLGKRKGIHNSTFKALERVIHSESK